MYYTSIKKVLALDLDNTLWGGIIGEDGINGIKISSDGYGKSFYDFQKEILNLKKKKKKEVFYLLFAKKNNETDVLDAFEQHSEMILSWNDFLIKKINWKDKATNLKEISNELNVGTDSIVFIDDNPTEREWVKTKLPEVLFQTFQMNRQN